MKILVLNCGSSSVKYKLIELDDNAQNVLAEGGVEKVGLPDSFLKFKYNGEKVTITTSMPNHNVAIRIILDNLTSAKYGCIKDFGEIDAVGHRVVHGGEKFNSSVLITDEVIAKVKECYDLAPLHNPANIVGIEAISEIMPDVPQVGVFDTAFHQTMPARAYMYALPYEVYEKYGVRDHRGGGRSSARITIARCVGGALAKTVLRQMGISVTAYTSQVGNIAIDRDYRKYDLAGAENNAVRCPDAGAAERMIELIRRMKGAGDTVGGIITCVIKGCPPGLGEPEFGKLHAMLGGAMLGINAVKGFEYGDGFDCVTGHGSEQNDVFDIGEDGRVVTLTNHSGGIQGGISNGNDIFFRVAFKPVATILQPQRTVDVNGRRVEVTARGRHDACVVPRAVPVVEAMAAMVILDCCLLNRTVRL